MSGFTMLPCDHDESGKLLWLCGLHCPLAVTIAVLLLVTTCCHSVWHAVTYLFTFNHNVSSPHFIVAK